MSQQATRFGTELKMGCTVTKVEKGDDGAFTLTWNDLYQGTTESERFKTVIIATGASARYLGLPGEKDFLDGTGTKSGLTACATCDGAFYKEVPVVVVGGGDTAAEEATFLTKFASKVYLLHRRDTLRASKVMAERVLAQEKVEPVWNTVMTEYLTDDSGKMRGIAIENIETGEKSELEVKGVFMAAEPPSTASSLPETCGTTPTVRPFPLPAWAAWRPWKPSATSKAADRYQRW
jgi:thioredoxin reductase (NADPH)